MVNRIVASMPLGRSPRAFGTPNEITHKQASDWGAINRAPERNTRETTSHSSLPSRGNEIWVCEEIVKQISVKNRLICKLLPEIATLDRTRLTLFRGKVKLHASGIPYEATTGFVIFHVPVMMIGRRGIEINDMISHSHFGLTEVNLTNTCKVIAG